MSKKLIFVVGSFLFVAIAVVTSIGGNWQCIKSYFVHHEDPCKVKPNCYDGKNLLKLSWDRLKGGCENKPSHRYGLSYFTSSGNKNTASKCPGSSNTDCGWKCELYDKKNRAVNNICTWPMVKGVCSGEPISKQLKELAVRIFVYLKELMRNMIKWVCSIPCLNFLCSKGPFCVQSTGCNVRSPIYGKNVEHYKQQIQRKIKGSSCPLRSSSCSGIPKWKRAKEILIKILCFTKTTISRAANSLHSWLKKRKCHQNDIGGVERVKMAAASLRKNIPDDACKRRDVFPKDPPKKIISKVAKKPCQNQLAITKRRHKECPYCRCGMNPKLQKRRQSTNCKQPTFVLTFVLAVLSALVLHLTVLPLLFPRPEN